MDEKKERYTIKVNLGAGSLGVAYTYSDPKVLAAQMDLPEGTEILVVQVVKRVTVRRPIDLEEVEADSMVLPDAVEYPVGDE